MSFNTVVKINLLHAELLCSCWLKKVKIDGPLLDGEDP